MSTPTSDPLDVLLAHNHWATQRVLELCRPLSREQFHRSFPIGPGENGGLHATLTHIVGCMRRWADRIAEAPVRPSIEKAHGGPAPSAGDGEHTVAELSALLNDATDGLRRTIDLCKGRGLDTRISMRFGDKTYTFTRGAALAHVLTHGHYHRAQCVNMLRHLGVPGVSDRLPELDVCDWQAETELPGVKA